jgi:three-Cys-motif partner protein
LRGGGRRRRDKRPTYIDGPDDLPARIVGGWVERKAFYVGRAASIFATGMKNLWPRRCYIELFAGPGLSWNERAKRFVAGSALMAMDYPFTDYFFVDVDPIATSALERRAEAKKGDRELWVRTSDCNVAVAEIVPLIPAGALSLVFVDPTAAQISFRAIERVAALRADLLFTFHVGAFRRAARTARAREIDAFFPPGADWRAALRLPLDRQIDALLALYLRGLEPYGYRQEGSKVVPMRNSRNALMYVLVLFTKHPRGQDFWAKAIGDEETGQTRAFPWI